MESDEVKFGSPSGIISSSPNLPISGTVGNRVRSMSTMTDRAEFGEIARFAVPKKGRLYEQILDLLKGIGLEYVRKNRLDIAYCTNTNFPLQLVFLPAQDIATFVAEGNIDLGITGQDIIAETEANNPIIEQVLELGFGKCRLALQAPIKANITSPNQLAGKRICTSFPNLTNKYFAQIEAGIKSSDNAGNSTATKVKFVSGSVEAACGLGLADGVVDLVETGTTMKAAGLDVVSEILQTQAVLIANKNSKHSKVVETIKKRVQGYLTAQKYKMMYYNIPRDKLDEAKKLTPGRRAPTVTKLDDVDFEGEGSWISVGAMVENSKISDVMDKLQEIGATDIFVVTLDNCRV